jgi:hypothetical protein
VNVEDSFEVSTEAVSEEMVSPSGVSTSSSGVPALSSTAVGALRLAMVGTKLTLIMPSKP